MKLINTNTVMIKKSKFIAYYYYLDNLEEIDLIVTNLKKEHKKARHVTFAYIFDGLQKKNDAGEPAGTAGMPILKILLENNLNSHLLVVVRYYGGIKLGSGGLIRAYLNSAKEVIKKS